MERRSFVRGAGLAGVLAAGAAPAIVHAQANIRWRLLPGIARRRPTAFAAWAGFEGTVMGLAYGVAVALTRAPIA